MSDIRLLMTLVSRWSTSLLLAECVYWVKKGAVFGKLRWNKNIKINYYFKNSKWGHLPAFKWVKANYAGHFNRFLLSVRKWMNHKCAWVEIFFLFSFVYLSPPVMLLHFSIHVDIFFIYINIYCSLLIENSFKPRFKHLFLLLKYSLC